MTSYLSRLSSIADSTPFASCPPPWINPTISQPIDHFRRPLDPAPLPNFMDPIETTYRPFKPAFPGHRGNLGGFPISIWDEIAHPGLHERVDRFNGRPIFSYDRSSDPALSTFLTQRTGCGIAGCLGRPDFTAPLTSTPF